MRIYDIIAKKRDSAELSDEEISFFVKNYTDGRINDSQAAALMMAIYINGMSKRETVTLTLEMARSGDMLDLSGLNGVTADKHSTGGVGDKTTLIVAPVAAALGIKIAKMSGRGLGHTGGTIDKLEAIPGFCTGLTPERFERQVNDIGISVVGQTGRLAPADKKIYALRNDTATVGCIPLIASSIMSKKLAAGSECIVLDVKEGSGAFMKTPGEAVALAQAMVDIGKAAGRRMAAVVTDMDTPLGCNIGNALEITEAVEVLNGKLKNDLYEVSLALASKMAQLALMVSAQEAERLCKDAIESKAALEKFRLLVTAQDGDVSYTDDTSKLSKSPVSFEIKASRDGFISFMDAEKIGTASLLLGAGRDDSGKDIDYGAGIILSRKTGQYVKKGETVATLYTSAPDAIHDAADLFSGALSFSDIKPEVKPLIYKVID